jgi:hypothetical protein
MTDLAIAESNTERFKKIKQQPAQLRCSGCGVTVDAACDCGKPYVSAGVAAAKAIKAHPEKSNSAIAQEIGVNEKTVRRIRGSAKAETDRRIGKDGKSYPTTNLRKSKAAVTPRPEPIAAESATPIDDKSIHQSAASPERGEEIEVEKFGQHMQPEPAALLLSQIEQLVGDLTLAVGHSVQTDIFNCRIRGVAKQLLALIASTKGE